MNAKLTDDYIGRFAIKNKGLFEGLIGKIHEDPLFGYILVGKNEIWKTVVRRVDDVTLIDESEVLG